MEEFKDQHLFGYSSSDEDEEIRISEKTQQLEAEKFSNVIQ